MAAWSLSILKAVYSYTSWSQEKLKALKNAVYFLPKIITAKDSYYLAYQEQWGILFSNRFVIKIQTNILNISSLQLFLVLLVLDQVRFKTNKNKKMM